MRKKPAPSAPRARAEAVLTAPRPRRASTRQKALRAAELLPEPAVRAIGGGVSAAGAILDRTGEWPGQVSRMFTPPRRRSRALAVFATIGVTMALAASCRSAPLRQPLPEPPVAAASPLPAPLPSPVPAPEPSLEAFVAAPQMRIGILGEVRRASLAADSGVIVHGELAGTGHRRSVRVARATFVAVSPSTSVVRYRVQVASMAEEAAAREVAKRAGEVSGLPADVQWSSDTGTWQVRIGPLASRPEAEAQINRLSDAELGGAWVVEEASSVGAGAIRLTETGELFTRATLYPVEKAEPLSADGNDYRGVLEVRAGESGVTVVNIVNLEDYLRGVVPNELSPSSFPEIEALKAQAVAARTYALRNRGQYKSRGYDLCATPACQVYRGRSSEQALSDQAVQETEGIAAFYRGSLIEALYTSTCGGHTEDTTNVFEGKRVPYLRGVSCAPERSAWTTIRSRVTPRLSDEVPGAELAVLGSLGIADSDGAGLKSAAGDEQLRDWTARLLAALHRKPCSTGMAEGAALGRRGAYFRYLVGSLCWLERERLLQPEDVDYLLHTDDRRDIQNDAEKVATALLIHEGVLTPYADNTVRVAQPLTRGQALALLARVALKAGPPSLLRGTFRSAAEGALTVERDGESATFMLDPAVRLFRALDGVRLATSEVSLTSGDTLRYVLKGDRIVYLEVEQSVLGASADRGSKYYRWEVGLTPGQVAEGLARYGTVGEVKDIVPLRHGVSGRVAEMSVVGSDGQLTLTGLKIRWALGLRENLFVIDRQTDARGQVERFIFTGKGWGHGVGLCQVGAFGLAHAGKTYEEVLRHYYPGVSLMRAY